MDKRKLIKSAPPMVEIDTALEVLKEKVLFQDKLNRANKTLKAVELPILKQS